MSALRDQLLAAIDAGDHQAIHRRGWGEVWADLATGWAPRQGCTMQELGPYVRLLADRDPGDVVEAIRELAGEWRPTPGAVLGYLNRQRGDATRVDVGRASDPAATPHALAAVAAAHDNGEPPCSCGAHRSTWSIDAEHVLRCRSCRGLEPGQLNEAEDAGLLKEAA